MLAHDDSRRACSQTAGNALHGSAYLWRLGPDVRLRREHFGGVACDTGTGTLVEVDRWTGFSKAFDHAGGGEPRSPELRSHLYAVLVAQACNFGLTTMADLAELSCRRLAWCQNWYVREETLQKAVDTLVNFQCHQPLSRVGGDGRLSSSDGQRFAVSVPNRLATALPGYFGHGPRCDLCPGRDPGQRDRTAHRGARHGHGGLYRGGLLEHGLHGRDCRSATGTGSGGDRRGPGASFPGAKRAHQPVRPLPVRPQPAPRSRSTASAAPAGQR